MEMDAAKPKRELGCSEMNNVSKKNEIEDLPMSHREITLADGRYMIFYTFGESHMSGEDQENDHREDV